MTPIPSSSTLPPAAAASHIVKPQTESSEAGMAALADNLSTSCKKIVRFLWDPEPKNDDVHEPIWCLGREYKSCVDEQGSEETSPPGEENGSTPTDIPPQDQSAATSTPTEPASASTIEVATSTSSPTSPSSVPKHVPWPPAFLNDVESRVWMTYRSDFAAIPRHRRTSSAAADNSDAATPESDMQSDHAPSLSLNVRLRSAFSKSDGFDSDTGWGCMIRSGQMVLANALYMLAFGRDWRHDSQTPSLWEAEILKLFADDPLAPFSVHKFAEYGTQKCGMYVGEWFGPSTTARCIGALIEARNAAGDESINNGGSMTDTKVNVYVSPEGGDVCETKFCNIATGRNLAGDNNTSTTNQDSTSTTADASSSVLPGSPDTSEHFTPMLILLGTRLGLDAINPSYYEALKRTLRMKQSVGIAGGRPSSSHYFMGVQGTNLFFLDPHQTRRAISWPGLGTTRSTTDDAARHSVLDPSHITAHHTRRLRRMPIKEIDPSMLIGFFIQDWQDWQDFKEGLKRENEEVEGMGGKPIVTLVSKEDRVERDFAALSLRQEADTVSSTRSNGQRPSQYTREEAIDEVMSLADEDEGIVD